MNIEEIKTAFKDIEKLVSNKKNNRKKLNIQKALIGARIKFIELDILELEKKLKTYSKQLESIKNQET